MALVVLALLSAASPSYGSWHGAPPPSPLGSGLSGQTELSLGDAVRRALERYPAVRISSENFEAAADAIRAARMSYLPRADILGQINYATRNNVFGLLLPQSVIPSISGPVLAQADDTAVWGSAVGVLVSWEPFDFGLRAARVDVAEAAGHRADARLGLTRLQVGVAAADSYLTLLAAGETERGARAGLERARVAEQVVGGLVTSELRPGVDLSRARAERARSEAQVVQAEQAVVVARVNLALLIGADAKELNVSSRALERVPDEETVAALPLEQHPVAREQVAAVEEATGRRDVAARSFYPRIFLQASRYARGTGARTDGSREEGFVGPNIDNWALGLTVAFPALDIPGLLYQRRAEDHRLLSEAARYETTLAELRARLASAEATLASARRLAQSTPVQLEAAQATEQQVMARYRAGLATIVEVADAERLLTQAEIDDALARLNVWRSLLALDAARGSLDPFTQQAEAILR